MTDQDAKAPAAGLSATESAERGEVDPAVELVALAELCMPLPGERLTEETVRQAMIDLLRLLRRNRLLLPPVAQTWEEWSVVGIGGTFASPSSARSNREHNPASLRNRPISVRTITTFADDGSPYGGATLTGKWRNVDE